MACMHVLHMMSMCTTHCLQPFVWHAKYIPSCSLAASARLAYKLAAAAGLPRQSALCIYVSQVAF